MYKNVTCISHGLVAATSGVGSGHCHSISLCIRAGLMSCGLISSGDRACAGAASIAAKVAAIKIRIALFKWGDCGRSNRASASTDNRAPQMNLTEALMVPHGAYVGIYMRGALVGFCALRVG